MPRLIGAWLAVDDSAPAVAALRTGLADRALDWQALMAFANEQLVVPLLHGALAEKGLLDAVPEDVAAYLSFLAARNDERNGRLEAQILEVCRALNDAGITPMLIKGAAELMETPGSAARQVVVGDVDLLVPPESAEAAARALVDLGYAVLHRYPADSHAVADLYRPKDAAVIDLHRRPLELEALFPNAAIWAAATAQARDGARFRRPAAADHLLCRVLHDQVQDGRLGTAEVNLRSAYQVARALQRHSGQIDLAAMRRRLQPHGLATALTSSLLAAHDLFGAPIGAAAEATMARGLWSRAMHQRRLLRLRYPALGRLNNAIGNMWSPFARHRYTPEEPGTVGRWRLLTLRLRHGVPALAQYGGALARRLLGA